VATDGGLVELSAMAMSLEEVFLQLTTDAPARVDGEPFDDPVPSGPAHLSGDAP